MVGLLISNWGEIKGRCNSDVITQSNWPRHCQIMRLSRYPFSIKYNLTKRFMDLKLESQKIVLICF